MPLAYGLVQPVELYFPRLPRRVDGWRIAHISDLHVTRAGHRGTARLVHQLGRVRVDLVAMTGDYMTKRKPIGPAVEAVRTITGGLRPRHGFVGVFGNHDSPALREAVADLPVRWLSNSVGRIDGWPMDLWGLDCGRVSPGDAAVLALQTQRQPPAEDDGLADDERRFRLLLGHYPDFLLAAAEMGVDLMLTGHTHGGQVRLPGGISMINSTGLPLPMSAGVIRHFDTTMVISRGIGTHTVPLRLFCPPHVPIYTLRRGTPPEAPDGRAVLLRRW